MVNTGWYDKPAASEYCWHGKTIAQLTRAELEAAFIDLAATVLEMRDRLQSVVK